jgi:cytochrome b involved in lipid metabolism
MTQVATHNTSASCWAAVSGSVYDLTAWIGEHPGGRDRIIGLCGTDATAAFAAQHRGQGEPAEELTRFKIGTLAG